MLLVFFRRSCDLRTRIALAKVLMSRFLGYPRLRRRSSSLAASKSKLVLGLVGNRTRCRCVIGVGKLPKGVRVYGCRVCWTQSPTGGNLSRRTV